MLRHPRTSTLFPYTTLFRSQHAAGRRRDTCRRSDSRTEQALLRARPLRSIARISLRETLQGSLRVVVEEDDAADRKSTRLNSSHSQISYAVFCLKKKKRTQS